MTNPPHTTMTPQPPIEEIHIIVTADDPKARDLLTSAIGWIRRIEERREDLPANFFDSGTDPVPLRKAIDRYLNPEFQGKLL